MTVENDMYAGGWVKCTRCTVSDAIARKTYDTESKSYRCTDVAQCDAWLAELEAKGLVVPAPKVFEPTVKKPPAPKPTKPDRPQTKAELRAEVLARQLRDSAGLKDWAGKPWVNPHERNGKAGGK